MCSVPRYQSSWGQQEAHLGPVGPRWAPCWPHELCYQGSCSFLYFRRFPVYMQHTQRNENKVYGGYVFLWFHTSVYPYSCIDGPLYLSGPIIWCCLYLIPAWISNDIYYTMWSEITLYNGCHYLSIPELKLIYFSERCPTWKNFRYLYAYAIPMSRNDMSCRHIVEKSKTYCSILFILSIYFW